MTEFPKFRRTLSLFQALLLCLTLAGCQQARSKPRPAGPVSILKVPSEPDGLPEISDPETADSIPHDPNSFTQGLVFHNGFLWESTGRQGQSKVRKLSPKDGKVVEENELASDFFGEGLAVFKDQFYQLTWRAEVCLVYDQELALQKKLFYGTEGWGLTVDPTDELLVLSDGSSELRFLDPNNLITKKRLQVTDGNGNPVKNLNELEWVEGEIWANVWVSNVVCRIDPNSGKIKGWIRFGQLVSENQQSHEDVLNGLAYDPEEDTLWVTGKLWSRIYRINGVKDKFFLAE